MTVVDAAGDQADVAQLLQQVDAEPPVGAVDVARCGRSRRRRPRRRSCGSARSSSETAAAPSLRRRSGRDSSAAARRRRGPSAACRPSGAGRSLPASPRPGTTCRLPARAVCRDSEASTGGIFALAVVQRFVLVLFRRCHANLPVSGSRPAAPDARSTSRTGMPRSAMTVLVSLNRSTRRSEKCWPPAPRRPCRCRIASARCSGSPGPAAGDDRDRHGVADRGRDLQIVTVLGAVASMLVSTISPAPSSSTSLAQATASRPGRHAAAVDVDFPDLAPVRRCTRLGSMFTTMHWLPNRWRRLARRTRDRRQAAELIETLSQPACSRRADVVERADAAADGQRHEDLLGRAADDVEHDVAPLVAGRDVEEHQFVGPFLLVRAATSTGSPASRRLTKLVPFTTRPRSTSRQGITRLASIRTRPIAATAGANQRGSRTSRDDRGSSSSEGPPDRSPLVSGRAHVYCKRLGDDVNGRL